MKELFELIFFFWILNISRVELENLNNLYPISIAFGKYWMPPSVFQSEMDDI